MKSSIGRIAHLPGSNASDDDIVLTDDEAAPFFSRRAVVSEKLDGISLTARLSVTGDVKAGLKPDWMRALDGRVQRAADLWVKLHEDLLRPLVEDGTHVYGEWLWHRVHTPYDRLPSAALLYSMRDKRGRLVPRERALARMRARGLPIVEPLFKGVLGSPAKLARLCARSRWADARAEGLVVEIEERGFGRWAKWVEPGYRQPAARDMTGEKNVVVEEPS